MNAFGPETDDREDQHGAPGDERDALRRAAEPRTERRDHHRDADEPDVDTRPRPEGDDEVEK